MPHHGDVLPPEIMKEMMEESGPTGRYPMGRLADEDNGEIQIGIATSQKRVVLTFGQPVAWIGLDRRSAKDLITALEAFVEGEEESTDEE